MALEYIVINGSPGANGSAKYPVGVSIQEPFDHRVAHGDVEGLGGFGAYGRTPPLSTLTPPVDVWNGGGTYTGHPVGISETLEVFSSDANDTVGGTGATHIIITGLLDSNFDKMLDVIVPLNGTTPVTIDSNLYHRSGTILVIAAGSSGINLGEITLRHTTTTSNVFAVMPIGKNRTAVMAITVPNGYTLLIQRATANMSRLSGANGSANVSFRIRQEGGVYVAQRDFEITNSNGYAFENAGLFPIPERTDMKATVEDVSDNNTTVTVELAGVLEVNR